MFLKRMKNILFVFIALMALSSCSEYQKVLGSTDDSAKYKMAVSLYEKGQETGKNKYYKKSLRLQDQIINKYRGRPQGQKLSFLYANTYYQLGAYIEAGYPFERFTIAYPESDKIEEASFKGAKSYYYISPRYSLDQTDTEKALGKLQNYLNTYPKGKYVEEANKLVDELQTKLEKKAFEIAKQYQHTLRYKAAIDAMDNFILDYPGSPFREKAYYHKFDSAYLLAIHSYKYLQEERLKDAMEFYNEYIKKYPQGEFVDVANEHFEDIKTRLKNLKSTTS